MTEKEIIALLKHLSSPERAKINAWFFKTGKGQYGEGDKFLGLAVPQIRSILKKYHNLSLAVIEKLMENEYHEIRLFALLSLVNHYKIDPDAAYPLYIKKIKHINNWDLVDLSAPYIVGPHLQNRPKDILFKLAKSQNLWEKRIAIISTFYFTKIQKPQLTIQIAELLINDKHDLIHKAVGWMLREIGKRCSVDIEEEFLKKHAPTMPRTALRYAIEHFPEDKKRYYMNLKNS